MVKKKKPIKVKKRKKRVKNLPEKLFQEFLSRIDAI